MDAVIHLAGASIGGRFTAERKNEIRDSRILPTRSLAELAAAAAASTGACGPSSRPRPSASTARTGAMRS